MVDCATSRSTRWPVFASRPLASIVVLAVSLWPGCGRPTPTGAHDKPISYWVESLQSPDARLRRQSARVLGNIGAVDDTVVPALSRALGDSDRDVKHETILALMKIGAKAKDAAPALAELRHDRNLQLRADAEKALEVIEGNSQGSR